MSPSHTERLHGLKLFDEQHPKVMALQEQEGEAEIHGHRIWSSSFFIIDHLRQHPLDQGAKVLDVGCGWGLLGIYCAKTFGAKVHGVDADPKVFPFLQLHARENQVRIKTAQHRFEEIPAKRLKQLDLLAGGDVCFWNELVDPLFVMIEKAVRHGTRKIIIADPGRSPFLKLARRCEKYFNTRLEDVSILKPSEEEGYLLIIEGLRY